MKSVMVEALTSLEHAGSHKRGAHFTVSEAAARELVRRGLVQLVPDADAKGGTPPDDGAQGAKPSAKPDTKPTTKAPAKKAEKK